MKMLFAALAAFGFIGGTAIAAQPSADNEMPQRPPEAMTVQEMDEVTAGNFGGTTAILRTINMGSYMIVFDGVKWTRVFK